MVKHTLRILTAVVLLGAVGGVAVVGYRLARTRVASDVYRQRLAEVTQQHDQLIQTYNKAVARTAVTELVVEDGKLSVAIVTADGQQRVIPTGLNPASEIFVDYAVIDGRLPVIIDPLIEEVDWSDPNNRHGLAIYRSYGHENGRWIVTVTGGGSLGLEKVDRDRKVALSPPPTIEDYEQIERQAREQADQVSPLDVAREVFSR